MEVRQLTPVDPEYPAALKAGVPSTPEPLSAIGNLDLLRREILVLFCSRKCPGSLILDAQEWVANGALGNKVVVGGFHTSVEKECLRLLLRDGHSTIVCPARGLERFRVPASWREPLQQGKLLILSRFAGSIRRSTRQFAAERNSWLTEWADRLLFIYAAPGGETEKTFQKAIEKNKECFTFNHSANSHLLSAGAQAIGALG